MLFDVCLEVAAGGGERFHEDLGACNQNERLEKT